MTDTRTLIEPRTLKGFRDHLPAQALARERILDVARRVYRSYGFVPIDTPALEDLEILTGKGSEETDKQLYSFEDHGGRAVGMRFDLTVPFARFAARHTTLDDTARSWETIQQMYEFFLETQFQALAERGGPHLQTSILQKELCRVRQCHAI